MQSENNNIIPTNTSLVNNFSVSSLLWRAGWSPSGLLQFRKQPIPATLLGTLERPATHHHQHRRTASSSSSQSQQLQQQEQKSVSGTVTPEVPSASSTANNASSNDFATTAATKPTSNLGLLAAGQNHRTIGIPLSIPLNATIRAGGRILENFLTGHASLAPAGAHQNNAITSPPASPTRRTMSRGPSSSNYSNNNVSDLSSPSSMMNPISFSSDFMENQFNDDILLDSRCKISVDGDGGFDTSFYVNNNVSGAPSASSGSWFGSNEDSLSEIDSMIFQLKIQIWDTPSVPINNNNNNKNNNNYNNNKDQPQRHLIASFRVTRIWKEIKRMAVLLHELHPELLIPAFASVDAPISSDASSQQYFVEPTSWDLELRLDMIKSLISSIQRNSHISTHSPTIVMFLMEEDHDAFYKFVTTMEQQLKAQGEERGVKFQQATEYKRLKEQEAFAMSNPGAAVVKEKKKDKEPGFFASLFGGSDDSSKKKSSSSSKKDGSSASSLSSQNFPQTIVNMIPHSAEQSEDAETRASTARFLVEDLNTELVKWKEIHNSFVAMDTSMRRMTVLNEVHHDSVRDFSDCLVENTNELVGANRARVSVLNSYSNNDSIQQVEAETKSNLRTAVMIMGSRADALLGGENMLSALCQSSKACALISKACVNHLLHHRILAERASQLSFLSQEDSENLLDFVVHTARPISIEEILVARSDLRREEHKMSVLFYSLSRQYCDTVLRCHQQLQAEASLMQQDQDDKLGWTISLGDDAKEALGEDEDNEDDDEDGS